MAHKTKDFFDTWERALEAYNTPRDFADDNQIILSANPDNSNDLALRLIDAPGFYKRQALMKRQKEETEERKRKNLEPRWENDNSDCFLCDNVGQSKSIGNNLILPFNSYKNYVVLPNRYPAYRGHCLVCSKEHYTFGNSLRPRLEEYVEIIADVSEKLGLLTFRNHPRAAMSIPGHEHSHSAPLIFQNKDGLVNLNGLAGCELQEIFDEGIFSISKTRIDTLAFVGKDSTERVSKIAHQLGKEKSIFTFAYSPSTENSTGTFYFTVHKKADVPGIKTGGGAPLYCAPFQYPLEEGKEAYKEMIYLIEEFFFKPGEFDWASLLKKAKVIS